jgi:hypothetical protein
MLAIRKMILRRLLNDLLMVDGHNVTIDSERGYDLDNRTFYNRADLQEAIDYALEFDEVHIFLNDPKEHDREQGYGPFVYVIFGNGNSDLDMISDYSTSLDRIMDPINEWVRGIEDGSIELTTRS